MEGVNGTEYEVHVTADKGVRVMAKINQEYQGESCGVRSAAVSSR